MQVELEIGKSTNLVLYRILIVSILVHIVVIRRFDSMPQQH